MFWFTRKKIKVWRYYREWIAKLGGATILKYDTRWAKGVKHARGFSCAHQYGWDPITTCVRVKKQHLHLSDDELSKLYGEKFENHI